MKYIATIGNFDGVHMGHRMLLQEVCIRAQEKGLRSLLYTFDFHTKGSEELLSTLEEKCRLIKSLGIEEIKVLDFSCIRNLEPWQFIDDLQKQNVQEIIVGDDFCFGKNASGTTELLRALCKERGMDVKIFPSVQIGNKKISSSYLREELKKGNIEKVNTLLQSTFTIQSQVVDGFKRGEKLGFRTANTLWPLGIVIPKFGVYYTQVLVDGKVYDGMTMVGIPFTFSQERFTVETHIFHYNENIYGETISIGFCNYIRENKKFNSEEELKNQLLLDKLEVMRIASQ